jgi:hypothetical protein
MARAAAKYSGQVHGHPGLGQDLRPVGQVVRLPVHRDGEQRALAELVAEMAAPPAACHQPVEEVGQVKGRPPGELVERADEPQAELLPHQHRPGHVDIRRAPPSR